MQALASPKEEAGLKIAFLGFLSVLAGGLLHLVGAQLIGFVIVVLATVVVFFGLALHFFVKFWPK